MKFITFSLTILAFLLAACGTNVAINTDGGKVNNAAAEIASIDLPSGYRPEFTASMNGYTVVSFTPGDDHSHLYLVQSQDVADADKLAQAMDEIVPGASDPEFRMTVLETRPISIRGRETALVISEGTNSEGETYRQALAAFDGKGGPALLVFSEPISAWEPDTVDTLVASIR